MDTYKLFRFWKIFDTYNMPQELIIRDLQRFSCKHYLVPERKLAFFHDSANSLSLTPAVFRRRSVNFLFWWCSMVQIRYSGRILAAPFPCFVLFSATSRAFRPLFCKGLVVERLLVVLARGAWRPNAEYCVPRWRGPRSA